MADNLGSLRELLLGNDPVRLQHVEVRRAQIHLAQDLVELRASAGLSQRALAAFAETTPSVISRLENAAYDGYSLP